MVLAPPTSRELRCFEPWPQKPHDSVLKPIQPEPVAGVPLADSIAGADQLFCSIHRGKVTCWGRGKFQPGLPYRDRSKAARAEPISLPKAARPVGVGYEHACAALEDDSLWCWGLDDEGQLGVGRTATSARPQGGVLAFPRAQPRR